jgi:hypothetical protein
MAQETKPLKKNDEVYIKSLGLYGNVLGGRAAGEQEEDQFYTVQITYHCRPSDLELVDHEADRKKHEAEIQQKFDRFTRAHEKIMAGDTSREAMSEYISATNDHQAAMGRPPLFVKK